VASAVAGVLARPATPSTPKHASQVPTGTQCTATATEPGNKSVEELLSALKLARAAQRRRKKVNRGAAKAKAGRQQQETGGEEVTQSLGVGGAPETAAPPAQSRDQPAPEASLESRSAGMTVDTVAVSDATSDTVRTWRDRLVTVYAANNPSKIRDIDDLLAKYQGQEDYLYFRVCKKYNVQPDDECSITLEAMQQQWQQMQQVYTQAVGMMNDMFTSTTRGEDSQQPGEAAPSLLQKTEPPPLKQVDGATTTAFTQTGWLPARR